MRFIEYTNGDINRIESEIDKLSLYKQDGWITESDIRSIVLPSIETSVFSLTDAVFSLDPIVAHREYISILSTHNIHQIATTLLSTLRNFLYASVLLSRKYDPSEVSSALKIHPYAFEKMRKNMRNAPRIASLFSELVRLDGRVKVGDGIGDSDDALKIGLEKAILCLQKK